MNIILRLLLLCCFILGFGYFVMYNQKVLKHIDKTKEVGNTKFSNIIGKRIRNLNVKADRAANINKDSFFYKSTVFFRDIIVNLDMERDNVTPVGLLVFISSLTLVLTLILVFLLDAILIIVPMYGAIFFLIIVIFKFCAILRYEKREAEIMDAVDLLVSDVQGGVYNAIVRYQDAFHENIRPYFKEFLDDIKTKGYGFRQAMLKLNDKLGHNFTDFTQKAIMYEDKADEDMDDIFSVIIETNRCKRTLRYINNQKFMQLRTQFLISMILIGGYCLFATATDPFLSKFFTESSVGKLLIVLDIVGISGVLAYLAGIKAKSL